jgi:hypothetical protein
MKKLKATDALTVSEVSSREMTTLTQRKEVKRDLMLVLMIKKKSRKMRKKARPTISPEV